MYVHYSKLILQKNSTEKYFRKSLNVGKCQIQYFKAYDRFVDIAVNKDTLEWRKGS